jgi:hypothetical protein
MTSSVRGLFVACRLLFNRQVVTEMIEGLSVRVVWGIDPSVWAFASLECFDWAQRKP